MKKNFYFCKNRKIKEMNETEALFLKDQFAANSNIKLTEVGNGAAVAQMEITSYHYNGLGIVQGGAIYTLADFALAAAANSRGPKAVTLTTTITFFKAESSGTFFATAREISLKRTVATYQVDVVNEKEELIAALQGTVYIIPEK